MFFQSLFLGSAGTGFDVLLKLVGVGIELGCQRNDVLGTHARQGAFVIAVQVDQTLEGFVFTGAKKPIDGALLVGFQVILEELGAQVAADGV
ncbi:hypothetical protein D3C78_1700370 [compost metagenome]